MFLATDKGECVDVAFVAQGLEHWSCKPGVESSNLSEGFSCALKMKHAMVKGSACTCEEKEPLNTELKLRAAI